MQQFSQKCDLYQYQYSHMALGKFVSQRDLLVSTFLKGLNSVSVFTEVLECICVCY